MRVKLADKSQINIDADTIIISTGYKVNNTLYKQLENKVPELYNIGDSNKPDSIVHAVSDGYYIALKI